MGWQRKISFFLLKLNFWDSKGINCNFDANIWSEKFTSWSHFPKHPLLCSGIGERTRKSCWQLCEMMTQPNKSSPRSWMMHFPTSPDRERRRSWMRVSCVHGAEQGEAFYGLLHSPPPTYCFWFHTLICPWTNLHWIMGYSLGQLHFLVYW